MLKSINFYCLGIAEEKVAEFVLNEFQSILLFSKYEGESCTLELASTDIFERQEHSSLFARILQEFEFLLGIL